VWYAVRTSVNNTEPLFWSQPNRDLFKQTLYEARQIFGFSLSGLRFSGPEVSFYIKPDDGLQLPEIMQWIKQTFAARFNVLDGRTGHIWGVRFPPFITNLIVSLQTIINHISDCGNSINIIFYYFRFAMICYGLPRFARYHVPSVSLSATF
jgi:hypothetical protein